MEIKITIRDHVAVSKWPSSKCPQNNKCKSAGEEKGLWYINLTGTRDNNRERSLKSKNRATIDFTVPS